MQMRALPRRSRWRSVVSHVRLFVCFFVLLWLVGCFLVFLFHAAKAGNFKPLPLLLPVHAGAK